MCFRASSMYAAGPSPLVRGIALLERLASPMRSLVVMPLDSMVFRPASSQASENSAWRAGSRSMASLRARSISSQGTGVRRARASASCLQ